MKHALLFSLIALSLTLTVNAMDHRAALVARIKEPIEELKLISTKIMHDETFNESAKTQLNGIINTYQSLATEATDESLRHALRYIIRNLTECREMLDELHPDNRFWFFNPGWTNEDDGSDDQGLSDEERDEALNAEIQQDLFNVFNLLQ